MMADVLDALVFDHHAHRVTQHGETVKLTPREYSLLSYLVDHAGQAFSRADLLDSVWGAEPSYLDIGTVTVHMRRLRLKVEANPDRPDLLVTVRGRGYRYDSPRVPRAKLGPPLAALQIVAKGRLSRPSSSCNYGTVALQARPHLQRTRMLRVIVNRLV
jgi:DNA-binding winged helix-turn-helix (wHTH) protein